MTQEDKELLFKDLCERLPYGVKVKTEEGKHPLPFTPYHLDFYKHDIGEIKPYLFPMSSMTEEQKNEFDARTFEIMFGENDDIGYRKLMAFDLDFYNKHHLDWRGIIEKGLAIDATNLNIY